MGSPSSTSSSEPARRGRSRVGAVLGLLLTLGAIGGALVVAEQQAARRFATTGPLASAARDLRLDRARKNVVVLGTCLSGQHISKWSVEEGLGGRWSVSNLGTAGSTPVEWYLAWKNLLPHDAIDVLLIAYGRFDLTEPMNPYETELLDLATPADVDQLAALACADAECRLDLQLQARSRLYRHRTLLAAQLWNTLGMQQPQDGDASRTRIVDGLPDHRLATYDHTDPSWVYLERLLQEAAGTNTRVVLLPLPLRPDAPTPNQQAERDAHAAAVQALAQRTGADMIVMPPIPADAFDDDVHLGKEGMEAFSVEVGRALGELAGG